MREMFYTDEFDTLALRTGGYTLPLGERERLTIEAFDICDASISVTVAGKACRDVTDPPIELGVDASSGKRLCQISCEVPPGQGRDRVVVIDRNG